MGEVTVQVRELTVGEIRQMLRSMVEGGDGDLVDYAVLDEVGLRELLLMTDLEPEVLEELAPSQLREVYEACREINKDFFALRARVEETGRLVLARLSGSLSETPVP
ncbi:hypothetical protein FEA48_23565 [Pseudomonas nitroreducens]|uniref:Uncharacterized protein n=1 Tax=Pseudomonas nitroreducens TaxID=46680 RepID=A0A5R8ZY06_PSENT|nr:hypothetical protein [Pseudomonas nitroreducens]TLP70814.1 hypothetical protein FEA48_23565 [Pseudomonas nitroreducens]